MRRMSGTGFEIDDSSNSKNRQIMQKYSRDADNRAVGRLVMLYPNFVAPLLVWRWLSRPGQLSIGDMSAVLLEAQLRSASRVGRPVDSIVGHGFSCRTLGLGRCDLPRSAKRARIWNQCDGPLSLGREHCPELEYCNCSPPSADPSQHSDDCLALGYGFVVIIHEGYLGF